MLAGQAACQYVCCTVYTESMDETLIQQQLDGIIAQNEGVPMTPEQQESFLHGYSWGALVYGFFYFIAVGDQPFAWLSLVLSLSVYLAPALLILPFFARRRAWQHCHDQDFARFYRKQRQWDRRAIYGSIALVVVFYILYRMLIGQLSTINQGGSDQSTIDQLQQSVNELQQN